MGKNFKRVIVFMLMAVLVVTLVGCGAAKTEEPTESQGPKEEPQPKEQKKVKISINHTSSLESPWQKGSLALAEYANSKSDNLEVEVFGNGVLCQRNWEIMLEMIQVGSTEAGLESVTALGSIVPELSSIQLPFLFDDMDHVNQFLANNPPIWQKWLKEFEKKGLVAIAVSPRRFRQLINNKVLVKTPEDIKGLKFRVPSNQMFVRIFELLGAKPVPLPSGEIYTSIQLGTVVGEDNSVPVVYDFKTHEVADKMTIWNYMTDYSIVVINKEIWESLSKEDQQILMEAGKEYDKANRAADDEYAVCAREEMEKAGVAFYDMPAAEKEPFKELVAPMYGELKEKLGEADYNEFMKAVDDAR